MPVLRVIGFTKPVLCIARKRVLGVELQKLDEGPACLIVLTTFHQIDRKIILNFRGTIRKHGSNGWRGDRCGAKRTFACGRTGTAGFVIFNGGHCAPGCRCTACPVLEAQVSIGLEKLQIPAHLIDTVAYLFEAAIEAAYLLFELEDTRLGIRRRSTAATKRRGYACRSACTITLPLQIGDLSLDPVEPIADCPQIKFAAGLCDGRAGGQHGQTDQNGCPCDPQALMSWLKTGMQSNLQQVSHSTLRILAANKTKLGRQSVQAPNKEALFRKGGRALQGTWPLSAMKPLSCRHRRRQPSRRDGSGSSSSRWSRGRPGALCRRKRC